MKKTSVFKNDTVRLCIDSCYVGLAAGAVAILYRFGIGWADNARSALVAKCTTPLAVIGFFVLLLLAGQIAGRLTESEILIKGSGIPQTEGELLGYFDPVWWKTLWKKLLAGILGIFGGLSVGAEGPSVQLGAMAGKGVYETLNRNQSEKRFLLICGASAGISAAFNAPLAGVMFGLEEIHKNFTSRAMLPCMISAIIADIFSKLFFGVSAALHLSPITLLPLRYYAAIIVFGFAIGAFGAFYNTLLLKWRSFYDKRKLPLRWRITVPFLVAGVLAFVYPHVLGDGHRILVILEENTWALGALCALLVAKLLFTMFSFGSGAPGGNFFPMLALGGLAGVVLGKLLCSAFVLSDSFLLNFMLFGMAGMFAGVVRAPLTGIVLVVEMSGSLTQLAGVSIVSCAACLMANIFYVRPFYEAQLDMLVPDNVTVAHSGLHFSYLDHAVALDSPFANKRVNEIHWPEDCLIVGIIRGTTKILPKGDTLILPGDLLTLSCPSGGEKEVRDFLSGSEEAISHA